MYSSKPPIIKTVTAMEFIPFNNIFTGRKDSGMMVVGLSDGSIALTNLSNNATITLNSNQLPPGKPAVTAIAAIRIDDENGTARGIIGFSNGQIYLYLLNFLAKDCKPACSEKYEIKLFPNKSIRPKVTGVTIISDESVAIALDDNSIKVVTFNPKLYQRILNSDAFQRTYIINKGLKAQIPCVQHHDTAAILTRQDYNRYYFYYVYVLTTIKALELYMYDSTFRIINQSHIANNVTRISAPHSCSTEIVFITSDNKIWLTNPTKDLMTREIQIPPFGVNFIVSQSAMTLVGDSLHMASIDRDKTLFAKYGLPDTAAVIASPNDNSQNQPASPPPYNALTQYMPFPPQSAQTTDPLPPTKTHYEHLPQKPASPPNLEQNDSSSDGEEPIYTDLSLFPGQ